MLQVSVKKTFCLFEHIYVKSAFITSLILFSSEECDCISWQIHFNTHDWLNAPKNVCGIYWALIYLNYRVCILVTLPA